MIRKPLKFIYGIKLIATWMLIPFVLMFVPDLIKEFSARMTTREVTLLEETYSSYPDEILYFKADIDGKERVVSAPVSAEEGDQITVILRNGSYYLTPLNAETMNKYMTFSGRFMRICNNNFGYHVIGIAAVLLLSFLITFKKRKEIRAVLPTLSKVTDIAGMITATIMTAAMLYGVLDNSLMGLGVAYICLFLGIFYTALFTVIWVFGSAVS